MTEFRFEQCLGRGGFGEVYRGVMSRGGGVEVDVAIKVLRPDLDPDSQGVQRLRDEGRLLGRLTHPAILRVYDLIVIEGRAALVSEYVPGDDLGRLLRSEVIPARAVLEITAQVAAALDAAWSWPSVMDGKPLHLVHRDVKPDNIRVDPHGGVKLLDFGIAQAQSVLREAQTRVNTIMGSTHYLAPERLVQQEVGPEADVFALGCTLFEALVGEALFARKSMRQMYLLMVDERKFDAFVRERCTAFPARLQERTVALLCAMLAWRKQSRPTAAEVASRCDTLSDGLLPNTPDGVSLTLWCRNRTWPPTPSARGPLEGVTFTSAQAQEEPKESPAQPIERLVLPEASATDPDRKSVLGETSGQIRSGAKTAVKRSVAAESPLPWAPAEMVAFLQSPLPAGAGRLPQLLRQTPGPAAPRVSATEAMTVRNAAVLLDPEDAPTVDAPPEPEERQLAGMDPSEPALAPVILAITEDDPTVDEATLKLPPSLPPESAPAAALNAPAETSAAQPGPNAEPPIELTLAPLDAKRLDSPVQLSFATGPVDPALAAQALSPLPSDFSDEQPTVRISRKPPDPLDAANTKPAQAVLPVISADLYRSLPPSQLTLQPAPGFDEEPPTVPAAGLDAKPVSKTPISKTPRSAEPRKTRRRGRDLRWLVTWGSSIAGLLVGSILVLFVAIAVLLAT